MKPFRVLSLDGGGMRGVYTATYLAALSKTFSDRRGATIDLGKAFDLIVGTSTGAIVGCALAAGHELSEVIQLYKATGPEIFSLRLPKGKLGYISELMKRKTANREGAKALRAALRSVLSDETLNSVYTKRGIALAVPSVELGQHRAWVFKTPHSTGTSHRDDDYTLVDVCMATSAAPIYRSLAAIDRPGADGFNVFADGGLWANNPVLVGLIDALELAEPKQEIEIFCLGTCPRPEGEQVNRDAVDRGILEWKGGGGAAALSIDAQEFAFDHMARKLTQHLNQECSIVRFPSQKAPASILPYLELDDSSEAAMRALADQAHSDANMTNSECNNPKSADGQRINGLFMDAPEIQPKGSSDV